MKRILLLLAAAFLFIATHAQKVALHSSNSVQYFTGTSGFVNAYNAATSGDTIYLPGGGFTSPGTISKTLLIFGAGHYPDSTQATSKTYINSSISLSEAADGLRIEGVDLSGSFQTNSNESVNNIIIKYCKITGDVNIQGSLSNPSSNLTIINTVITGNLILSNAVNAGIFNSILQGRIISTYGNLLSNNIFMFNYTGSSSYYTLNGDNNIVSNNIFLNASNRYISGTSNQAYNNSFITSPYLGLTPVGSGNYYPVEQTDIFVNQEAYLFSYEHDYHLQSPETYTGTDATQIGIYGGIHEYKEGAVPSNPHIQFENVASVTANGTLSIEIKAAAQEK